MKKIKVMGERYINTILLVWLYHKTGKMITKSQLKILEIFKNFPNRRWTYGELKENLKESSNNKLQTALANFEKESLIFISRKKGFNLISLNLDSEKIFTYFSLIDLERLNPEILDILKEIKMAILERTSFFSLIVFGSYAKNKSNKSSDLDIAIILGDKNIEGLIKPEINSIKRKSLIVLDIHYFSKKDLLEMVSSKKQNIGKEIVENNLVFYGGEFFYNLILKRRGHNE